MFRVSAVRRGALDKPRCSLKSQCEGGEGEQNEQSERISTSLKKVTKYIPGYFTGL